MSNQQHMPNVPNMTRWTNPTSQTVKFRVHRGPPSVQGPKYPGGPGKVLDAGHDWVVIEPGQTVYLPKELDNAVQTTNGQSLVVAGLAPQLLKDGERLELHPAIDPHESAKREAEQKAAEALARRNSEEAALLIAQARADEAIKAQEAAKREADKQQTAKREADERAKHEADEKAAADAKREDEKKASQHPPQQPPPKRKEP